MDEGKENRQGFRPLKIRKIFSRDLGIFFVFLFISFILWYLNSLRKETEATLRLQTEYVNSPSGPGVAGNFSSEVFLNISGKGYSILKFSMNRKNRYLRIDLSKVRPGIKQNNISAKEYYIVTGQVLKEYMKHLSSSEIKVLSVKPDTLFLSFVKNSSAGKYE